MDRGSGIRRSVVSLCVAGLALLTIASPAAADSVTQIGSFTDPRSDLPSRTGQLTRLTYGPYTIPANGQIHNAFNASAPTPCTNCRITDIVPDLVDNSGNPVNLAQGAMMHHFVLINTSRPDIVCSTGLQGQFGERFFASGNERTHMHLPLTFGYENDSATWLLIYHLVNKTAAPKTVNIQLTTRHRTKAETQRAVPAWLDIDGCSDSEYAIPTGYSDYHDFDNLPVGGPYTADWPLPWNARLISIAGHTHDVDITGGGSCLDHCANEGGGIAVSAELRGGTGADYHGPSPPNNTPPSDLTGATLCRSEANYGTPFAGTAWRGHLDTMSLCGIFTSVPGGAQPEAYPPAAALPADGYPVSQNQVIRLHSEYQNDTGFQQNDVMGIMMAWFALPNVYPRPGGAAPLRVPLVPEFEQCTNPNREHVPPLDYQSCSPPAQESAVLTTSTTGAQSGSAKLRVIVGDVSTPADEADVTITASATDVRKRSDGTDYVGKVLLTSTLRLTDKLNGPAEGGTVQDTQFNVPLNCVAVGGAAGATCSVNTTADALIPNTIVETKRTIMALPGVQVKDAGVNGTGYGAGCPPTCGDGDEKVFLRQGLFAP